MSLLIFVRKYWLFNKTSCLKILSRAGHEKHLDDIDDANESAIPRKLQGQKGAKKLNKSPGRIDWIRPSLVLPQLSSSRSEFLSRFLRADFTCGFFCKPERQLNSLGRATKLFPFNNGTPKSESNEVRLVHRQTCSKRGS